MLWTGLVGAVALFWSDKTIPGAGPWSHPIGHVVIFAMLTVSARVLWPRAPLAVTVAVLVAAGVALEGAQHLSGADAQAADIAFDLAGIAGGLVLVALGRRRGIGGVAVPRALVGIMAATVLVVALLPRTNHIEVVLDCEPSDPRPDLATGVIADFVPPGLPDGAAAALAAHVALTNEVTIEAWFRPSRLDQEGPARLVTISEGTGADEMDLHLGVLGTGLSARIRTECRLFVWLQVPDVLTDTGVHHVAATYSPGWFELWLDGRPVGHLGLRRGGLGNWDPSFPLVVGQEATGGRVFDGEVLAVTLHDSALSAVELRQRASSPPPLDR